MYLLLILLLISILLIPKNVTEVEKTVILVDFTAVTVFFEVCFVELLIGC